MFAVAFSRVVHRDPLWEISGGDDPELCKRDDIKKNGEAPGHEK